MNNCKFHYKVHKAMMPETKRTIIIHRHIFKNAGTTFDWILKNNFGDAFCDHRDDVPMRKEGEKYLMAYLTEHPEIKALSSHHIWFKIEPQSQLNLIPVMFLRHPIERIRSVYNFERIQLTDTPGALKAKTMNFSEYVKWSMNERVMVVIRNIHTRYLAGYKKVIDLTQEQLSDALKEVGKQKFIGIVDMFDESLRHFDNAFREIGIELDFSYRAQNVAQLFDNVDYEIRAQKVLEELGDVADEVMEKNRFDMIVYRAARKKLISGI